MIEKNESSFQVLLSRAHVFPLIGNQKGAQMQ